MLVPIQIGSIKTHAPSAWEDVTTAQYIDMVNYGQDMNLFRLLSILSGVDYQTLLNIDSDTFDNRIFDVLLFAIESPIDLTSLDKPETITVNGKEIRPPYDAGKCTIGQKLNIQAQCRQAQDGNGNYIELLLYCASTYLQPLIDGDGFKDTRVPEVMDLLKQLPIVQIYPLGGFFLRGYITYLKLSDQPLSSSQQPRSGKRVAIPYSKSYTSSTPSSS